MYDDDRSGSTMFQRDLRLWAKKEKCVDGVAGFISSGNLTIYFIAGA